jgi:hypothetical protein
VRKRGSSFSDVAARGCAGVRAASTLAADEGVIAAMNAAIAIYYGQHNGNFPALPEAVVIPSPCSNVRAPSSTTATTGGAWSPSRASASAGGPGPFSPIARLVDQPLDVRRIIHQLLQLLIRAQELDERVRLLGPVRILGGRDEFLNQGCQAIGVELRAKGAGGSMSTPRVRVPAEPFHLLDPRRRASWRSHAAKRGS